MAYNKSERYTLPMSSTNTIRLPAVELAALGVAYNDEIEITLYPSDQSNVKSITFTGFLNSDNTVTVPKKVREAFGAEEVTVSFEATGRSWSPDIESSARKAVYESANPNQTKLEAVTDVASKAQSD